MGIPHTLWHSCPNDSSYSVSREVVDLLASRFNRVLLRDPLNARAAFRLAQIYLDEPDFNKAEEMLLQTLQIDPAYRSALYNLGLLYNHLQR